MDPRLPRPGRPGLLAHEKDDSSSLPEGRPPVDSSAMFSRAGPIARWLGRTFFGAVKFEEPSLRAIRDAVSLGVPVYVLNVRSLLDYLYFNFAFVRNGLPLVHFATGLNLLLFRPFWEVIGYGFRRLFGRLPKRLSDRDMMEAGLRAGRPCLVFLKRGKTLIQWGSEVLTAPLQDLVDIQQGLDRPILLLPLLLVWDQKPETYRRTFVDVIFGDPQAPGRLRKVVSFALNFRKARVHVGHAIDLKAFLGAAPEGDGVETNAARLRFALSSEFLLESKAIRGPALKGARRIVDEVVRTPPFIEEVRSLAAREGVPYESSLARARTYLKAMAADFRFNWLEGFSLVLGIVFHRLFKGIVVDTEGLREIRQAARDAPIVLVPAHRSHIDYLMLSVVFYMHGLIPPHIASGENLSFWPMGLIFRRSGAFFIRRSTKGNELYAAVLRHYVRKLVKDGYWVEFFIEGTRSRSGKCLNPKYGMLSMIVDAVASGGAPDAYLVPCAITYEKVIEERSYTSESGGSEKKKENFAGLAASAKVLGSRYGKVYVQFEHPVSLKSILASEGVPVPVPAGDAVPRETLSRLGHSIMQRINGCWVVSPYNLVAFALLTYGRRGIEHERLLERVGFLVAYVAARGGLLSDLVLDPLKGYDLVPERGSVRGLLPADNEDRTRPEAIGWALRGEIDDVLRMLEREKAVQLKRYEDDWVVRVVEDRRPMLDYYKNGMIQFFATESILGTVLLRVEESGGRIGADELVERMRRLAHVFRTEFVFGVEDPATLSFEEPIRHFAEERLLVREGDEYVIAPGAREPIRFFAEVLAPLVESYRIVSRVLNADEAPVVEKEVVKACLRTGRKLLSLEEIKHSEAISVVCFRNALSVLRASVASGRTPDLKAAAKALEEVLGREPG